jgi:thiol-disulfide isomerase/thioredoxin
MLAVLTAVMLGAIAGVLYVIQPRPVHKSALQPPPASLASLVIENGSRAVPAVAFTDVGGQRHTLAAFKGHYVLLNLWATWCAPCVRELPALAHLAQSLPVGRLAVVAVDIGRGSAADAATFLQAHDAATLPVYFDSDIALVRAFGSAGLPLSVILDPQGREIARVLGPAEWGDPKAIAYLRALTTPPAAHTAS